MQKTIAQQFRKHRRNTKLKPLINLTGSSQSTDIEKIDKIIHNGWSRRGYPMIDINAEIPWDDAMKTSRSWSFYLHCWDMTHDLLHAYTMTEDRKYFNCAMRIALDWIQRYPCRRTTSQFAWYDMAVGLRVYRLAYLLDAAARLADIPDFTIEAMIDSVMLHRDFLFEDNNVAFHNNHGLYQIAGQLAMSSRLKDLPGMDTSQRQAKDRLKLILSIQFNREGMHREHSPDYHRMVCDTLKGMIDSDLIMDQETRDLVLLIESNLHWFILPNGRIANFGDSDYRDMNVPEHASSWKSPVMQFMTSGGKIGKPHKNNIGSFPESGYFIVRDPIPTGNNDFSETSYIAQTLCFHSRTHKHADDLSFIWHDRGLEILVDAGRYGYIGKTEFGSELRNKGFWYSDPNRIFIEETRAHNTVEIDGHSNPRRNVKPYGSALKHWGATPQGLYHSSAFYQQTENMSHERLLIFNPKKWLIVHDILNDDKKLPHSYSQWFHFSPALSVIKEENMFTASTTNSKEILYIFSLDKQSSSTEVIKGRTKPTMQGWWSPSERTMVPNDTIAFEQTLTHYAVFSTLLIFDNKIKNYSSETINFNKYKEIRLNWDTKTDSNSILALQIKNEKTTISYNTERNNG